MIIYPGFSSVLAELVVMVSWLVSTYFQFNYLFAPPVTDHICLHDVINFSLFFSGTFSSDDSVGEVDIQIDLFTYAASGEHKVTVKGNRGFF